LGWGDLHEGGSDPHLMINRSRGQTGQEVYTKQPKTAAGRRRVDLPAFVANALRQYRAQQVDRGVPVGPENDVWSGPCGQITPNGLTGKYRDFIAARGLPKVRFHDLRHTFATHRIREGWSPTAIQRVMGHASVAITFGTYGHVFPEDAARMASQVDA